MTSWTIDYAIPERTSAVGIEYHRKQRIQANLVPALLALLIVVGLVILWLT